MDIASLGLKLDTISVEKGNAELDKLIDAAGRAEDAEGKLEQASREAGKAVSELGSAAKDAASGVAEMQRTTAQLGESEDEARARIREMVRASLDKQQAMIAAAAATKKASEETERLSQSERRIGADTMRASFAEAQQELVALSEAMAHQAQSLDDIGERRAWVTDLYERGLISIEDTESHMKALDQQERQLQKSIADHAREVQNLLNTYDPASAAIQKITEDEKRLDEALRSGAISAEQHQKAMAGLNVNRARWRAEAEGIKEVSRNLNTMALTSNAAFRDYTTLAGALSRGDMGLAANQVLQLSSRTGALRAIMSPLALSIGSAAAAAGALAYAFHSGQREAFEFNKTLLATGNISGHTAGELALIAENVDRIGGTRNAARETLAQLATIGRLGTEDLERYAVATQRIARNLDQPVSDTVDILKQLAREPLEASRKLNESTHHLTSAIDDQILSLQRRGEMEAAGALAQRAYLQELERRAAVIEGKLPIFSNAARSTADAFRELGDELSGLFVPAELEERLRELQEARGNRGLFEGRGRFLGTLQNRNDREEQQIIQDIARARAEAERRAEEHAAIEAKKRLPAQIAARLEREQAISTAVAGARAADVQRELADSLAQYSAYESQLEAQRAAGLIDEQTYTNERIKLVKQRAAAELEALEGERAAIEQENVRIRERAKLEADAATKAEDRERIEAQAQAKLIENQQRIYENASRQSQIRQQEIADVNVLTTAHEAHGRAITRSYQEATNAAQAYLETLKMQQERELAAFGRGGRQREIAARRNDIDDRFAQQRQQLESDRLSNPQMTQDLYEQRLAIIEDSHRQALALDEQYWARRSDLEGDFMLGAREAFSNYIDNARNVAAQSEDLFTNAFQGMTEALVEFETTGKSSFKELAQSIIADLVRIRMQAALTQIFGGLLSGLSASSTTASASQAQAVRDFMPGRRAGGGPIDAGRPYIVGERGPELIVPRMPGMVVPNHALGGTTINISSILNPAPGMNVAQFQAALDARDAELEGRILQGLSRGRYAGVVG